MSFRQQASSSMSLLCETGTVDSQLDSLRQAVKKERAKRGETTRKWCTATTKDEPGVTKKNSILHSRLAKTEVSKAMKQVETFDLFGGVLSTEQLTKEADVDKKKIKRLQDTRQQRVSEFAEIDAYTYDEESEQKRHIRRQVQPRETKAIAAPSPPPSRRKSEDSSSSSVRMRRQQVSTGNRTGGIWDVYELNTESKSALNSFRTSTKPKNNNSPPQVTPEKVRMEELQRLLLTPPAVGSNAAAHQQVQQEALVELQYLQQGGALKSYAKGTGSDPNTKSVTFNSTRSNSLLEGEFNEEANRKSFQEALRGWRTNDSDKQQPTGVQQSGGSLLSGDLDEDSNRRAFQEAVQSWRSSGQQQISSSTPSTAAVSTEAGAPMKVPIKPLAKEFINEYVFYLLYKRYYM